MKLLNRLYNFLRIDLGPKVKLYDGFGNEQHMIVYGHVFDLSPKPRIKYRDIWVRNTFALIRLFFISPMAGQKVCITWEGEDHYTSTEKDGFFKFEIPVKKSYEPGDYEITATRITRKGVFAEQGKALIHFPERNQFAFISDIDDTFLISHSGTILKRLYVLLTENAYTRQPFEGVVRHYNLLRLAQTDEENPNPFFYVSSSEWNLYNYIKDFVKQNNIPKGVFLLNQVKTLSQLFKTGKNNHGSKFFRIVRIIEAYPTQRFILLGDDSQRDPYIYHAIVKHFPEKIHCVYIRQVGKIPKTEVQDELNGIEKLNTQTCYFKHSVDAIAHSESLGLVPL